MTPTLAFAVALVAAFAASAGDFLLLRAALHPEARGVALVLGHHLGVLAIPLFALGYAGASSMLRAPAGAAAETLALCGAGIGALGAVVHGATAVAVATAPTGAGAASGPVDVLAPATAFLAPLWVALGVLAIAASAAFFLGLRRSGGRWPAWLALAGPAPVTLVLAAIGAVSTTGRDYLVPAAPNLAHVVFFAVLLAASTRDRGGSALRPRPRS